MADQAPPENVNEPIAEGSVDPSTTPVLPEKIRVHALAKLLGVTSKQVLAEAAALGTELRSAQSSLQREIAERIHATVSGATETAAPEPAAEPVAEPVAAETALVEAEPEAAPVEKPAPRKRARKKAAPKAEAVVEPVTEATSEATAETEAPTAEAAPARAGDDFTGLFTNVEPGTEHEPAAAPAVVQAPLFLQPDAATAETAPRRRRSRRAAAAPEVTDESQTQATDSAPAVAEESAAPAGGAVDRAGAGETRTAETAETSEASEGAAASEASETDGEGGEQQRRRRRGRRGRGRGRGEQHADGTESDESDESAESAEGGAGRTGTVVDADTAPTAEGEAVDAAEASESGESAEDEQAESDESGDGSSRRRRRRRRRKGGSDGDVSSEDDPPNTVVHEREPRNKTRAVKDEVQGISGSTRLEAKRQRRRDGRDAGRRRPPILSESEFLARREAVDRVMVVREKVGGTNPAASTQVAVLEDGVLVEHFVTGSSSTSMVGNVYLGRVQNVLPSMEAAFIDIGRGRNGVLYAGEVNWEAAGLGGRERKIEQALKPGDQVLVQVSKDPVGHKGARLTTQISLAGRFLVYVPGGTSTGISRKLPDTERKRLKEILREIVPADAGVIIRTASEGVSEEELARDVTRLQTQWATIEEQAAKAKDGKSGTPQALYEEPDLLVKVVRDLFNEDFSKLVIEGEKAWSTVETYIKTVAPDLLSRVERYDVSSGAPDVFEAHRIDEQLAKALDRKVWLPSGGTLVIDRTEAMTVVDVNTGKFTGAGGNLEETVTRNNLEAAEEIVRQMRLRDIGGMIVVDFIDMVLESNRDLVLRRLTEALGRDRTRHQVSEVTSLGLVQMTRKKLGTGLVEAFSTTCEHCHGRGIIVHSEPVEVKSADDGGRGQSKESGSGRKKRGRDRATSAAAPEPVADAQPTHPSTEESAADATVKRAHPVALAMASHHDEHETGSDERAGVDVESTPHVEPAPEPESAPEPTPVAHAAESDKATESDKTAETDRDVPSRGRRRSRRVSRAAAAPEGETSDTGTVFVIPVTEPAPAPEPASVPEAAPDAAPAAGEAAAPPDGEVPAARRPRRRRAAGRPAGPPVDVEA
ncbi:translation initiation factor IF-2 N-terminal domain-containing protein [Prescottella defluvii]|uniref:translation initiation factor IF-2 N-terminal domain-containing protein n=1 Tax=Prescottella defluvii TaxID=1323361 RepID=UPI0004F3550A|nr:translation initiation factor IF-2 N-terminal domain-containing protein [Prescottella defluvii]